MEPRLDYHDVFEWLAAAAHHAGLTVQPDSGDSGIDLVVLTPQGQVSGYQVKTTSLITAHSVAEQLRRWSSASQVDVAPLVVANRITAEGRQVLNRAGWSWLDLRGHLRLVGPGLFVDSDVPALKEPSAPRQGLTGQVGVELAVLLLLNPAEGTGVRTAAAALNRAPSSVSSAFSALQAADLVDADRKPVTPDLFWQLAEHWKTDSEDLAGVPTPGTGRDNAALRLGLDDIQATTGWALTDTLAAAAYGAPVSMRADHPPEFFVPDRRILRRAAQLLGPASSAPDRACRVRVAPTPLVCSRRVDGASWSDVEWPLAHPLFVALDLAQDPGRGREILTAWTPRKPWHRAW